MMNRSICAFVDEQSAASGCRIDAGDDSAKDVEVDDADGSTVAVADPGRHLDNALLEHLIQGEEADRQAPVDSHPTLFAGAKEQIHRLTDR